MRKLILLVPLSCLLFAGCGSKNTETKTSNDYYQAEMESLQEEAAELAKTAMEVESGKVYDSIQYICSGAKLTRIEPDSLSVYLEDVDNVFSVIENICDNCNLESEYSFIAFFIRENESTSAMLSLDHYKSPTSFSSSFILLDSKRGELETEYMKSKLYKE